MTPEDTELCARLRDYDTETVTLDMLSAMEQAADRIEALAAERDVLRRVVRYADFFVEAGASSAYDEARSALTEFDMAAQEKTNAGV
jgi:DNA-binding response OmpR family regulator